MGHDGNLYKWYIGILVSMAMCTSNVSCDISSLSTKHSLRGVVLHLTAAFEAEDGFDPKYSQCTMIESALLVVSI